MSSGRAVLTFDHDHTIIRLGPANTWDQAAVPATDTPSIAVPAGGDCFHDFLHELANGDLYAWVDPESDLPEIGILDASRWLATPPGATFPLASVGNNLIRVGYNPIHIPKIQHALLFPPLARYFLGDANAWDLYDLGGETDNANLTPVDDIIDYRVFISFSIQRPNKESYKAGAHWRFITKGTITHAQADAANTRGVYVPAFCCREGNSAHAITAGALVNTDVANFYTLDHELTIAQTTRATVAIASVVNTADRPYGCRSFHIQLGISSNGAGDGTLARSAFIINERYEI